jgi:hypothetical protein
MRLRGRYARMYSMQCEGGERAAAAETDDDDEPADEPHAFA